MAIVTKETYKRAVETDVGAKAKKLAELSAREYNVPGFFVIDKNHFNLYKNQIKTGPDGTQQSAILELTLSDAFIGEVNARLDKHKKYAVRSSAIGEDGGVHSFAGQMDSFLNVSSQNVCEHVKRVWASAFSRRIMAYRKNNNLNIGDVEVAVLVQEMIEAEVSGVAFCLHPVTGDRRVVVISAVYGLGEGLVSGALDADVYTVSRSGTSDVIDADIQAKKKMVVYGREDGGSTVLRPVEPEKRSQPCLTDAQVMNIAERVRSISSCFGKPQDVEWAMKDGVLYILQSRPVTALSRLTDKTEQRRIWDNSNIIESYSGVTTPLTFSFVRDVYSHVYKQFCLIMGVEKDIIDKNASIFQMLGFIRGRIYYNLLNWYKVLSLLPGYAINAAFMEQMMGVKEKIDIPHDVIQSSKNKYLRVGKLFCLMIYNLCFLPIRIRRFFKLADKIISPFEGRSYENEKLDDLVGHYNHLERSLLTRWQAPLINDFFTMIFFGSLKKCVVKWGLDKNGTLQNDLLCGEGGIISTEPIKSLQSIANAILDDPKAKTFFELHDPTSIVSELSRFQSVKKAIEFHCRRFGDRCANELKLETITARLDQTIVIRQIQSYLKAGRSGLSTSKGHDKRLREEAEKMAAEKLKGKPLKKLVFSIVLHITRILIRNRENQRFERTRIFAAVRGIFLAIGQRFYREDLISHPRDIFFLTKEEIFGFINGTSVDVDLKNTIQLRHSAFAKYESQILPDRFESWGSVYHANSFDACQGKHASEGESLRGTGCSPGIAEGKVVVVNDPNNAPDLKGNIMLAERTDPGWAPLFPLAKGILVERGSLLSHSAIVAREMGIPAIVAIPALLNRLKTGDKVRFDGTTGLITLIKKAED